MNFCKYKKYFIRLTSIHLVRCSLIEQEYVGTYKIPHYWVRLLEDSYPYVRGERFYTNRSNLININGTKTDKNNKS